MTKNVVSTLEEFEDIKLDIDDIDEKSEVTDSDSIDSLNLDDVPSDEEITKAKEQTNELVDEVATKQPIDNMVDEVLSNIEINLDDIEDLNKKVEIPSKETSIEDTDNINIEIPEDTIKETPKEEKIKKGKGRPKKEVIQETPSVVENVIEKTEEIPSMIETEETKPSKKKKEKTNETSQGNISKCIYNPEFPVDKIKADKYQPRKNNRTTEELKVLSEKIALQGQMVPVQIHKEGEHYQMVDGFGRLAAIKLLNIPSIKALIHENLNQDELMRLSLAANIDRVDLSEWDKICSIGKFREENKLKYPMREDLVPIFGFSKSSVYKYCDLYDFFKDKAKFIGLFNTIRYSLGYFEVILRAFRQYKHITVENSFEYIKDKLDISTNKDEFETFLTTKFNGDITKAKKEANEIGEIGEPSIDNIKGSEFTGKANAQEKSDLLQNTPNKIKEFVETLLVNIISNIKEMESTIEKLSKIEKFKDLTEVELTSKIYTKMDGISKKFKSLL